MPARVVDHHPETAFHTVSEVRVAPVLRSGARHGPYPATCLGPQSTEIQLPLDKWSVKPDNTKKAV